MVASSQLLYRIADHVIASPGKIPGLFSYNQKEEYHGVSIV
jgi:hypothetical protein